LTAAADEHKARAAARLVTHALAHHSREAIEPLGGGAHHLETRRLREQLGQGRDRTTVAYVSNTDTFDEHDFASVDWKWSTHNPPRG
jgi:hypothetical protein